MSIQENKAIALRFIRVWDTEDPTILDELAAPDIRVSYPILPGPIQGVGAFKEVLARVRAGLPDITIEVGELIAEGDCVVAPWTISGTHLGELMGIGASGRRVTWEGSPFTGSKTARSLMSAAKRTGLACFDRSGRSEKPTERSSRWHRPSTRALRRLALAQACPAHRSKGPTSK